jgi:hypothetical protein
MGIKEEEPPPLFQGRNGISVGKEEKKIKRKREGDQEKEKEKEYVGVKERGKEREKDKKIERGQNQKTRKKREINKKRKKREEKINLIKEIIDFFYREGSGEEGVSGKRSARHNAARA